jgi:hypothetical protein
VSDIEASRTPAVRAVDGTRCTWLIKVLMSCLSSVAVVVHLFLWFVVLIDPRSQVPARFLKRFWHRGSGVRAEAGGDLTARIL